MKRRVVVTGIGILSPVGIGVEENWKALKEGKSGVSRITRFDPSDLPSQIAGEVKGFDPLNWIEKKDVRKMSLFIQYAIAAADEAFNMSGLKVSEELGERMGVLIGAGIGGIHEIEEFTIILREKGWKRVSP